jgi:hypothetical protein
VKDKRYPTVDEILAEMGGDTWPLHFELGPRIEGKHLITVDELRAAGALDVPPAMRKSLGGRAEHQPDSGERQRDLFSLFGDDDDTLPGERAANAQRLGRGRICG